jgi:hypothetical protein
LALNPLFRGRVLKGKLRLERRDLFDDYAASLEGEEVDCVLRRRVPRQNRKQQKLIHVLFKLMAIRTGRSPAYVKRWAKAEWLTSHTSEMDMEESAEFIEWLTSEAVDLGIKFDVEMIDWEEM